MNKKESQSLELEEKGSPAGSATVVPFTLLVADGVGTGHPLSVPVVVVSPPSVVSSIKPIPREAKPNWISVSPSPAREPNLAAWDVESK